MHNLEHLLCYDSATRLGVSFGFFEFLLLPVVEWKHLHVLNILRHHSDNGTKVIMGQVFCKEAASWTIQHRKCSCRSTFYKASSKLQEENSRQPLLFQNISLLSENQGWRRESKCKGNPLSCQLHGTHDSNFSHTEFLNFCPISGILKLSKCVWRSMTRPLASQGQRLATGLNPF